MSLNNPNSDPSSATESEKGWSRWYLLVVGALLLEIILFSFIGQYFS